MFNSSHNISAQNISQYIHNQDKHIIHSRTSCKHMCRWGAAGV